MARDSSTTHTDQELRDALWHIASGGDLRHTDPLRVELLQAGFVRRDATSDAVHLTREGRRFLDA